VVGDQGSIDITHLQLAGERNLWILGHVDDFPALIGKPTALGPRGEARALDHDDGAPLMDGHAKFATNHDAQRTQLWTVRVGCGDMDDPRAIVEGLRAGIRSVDELIADYEIAWFNCRL